MKRLLLLSSLLVSASIVFCLSAMIYGRTRPAAGLSGMIMLGDVVNKYGAPCRVEYLRSSYGQAQIYFIYPQIMAYTPYFEPEMLQRLEPDAQKWYLTPRMPVISIDNISDDMGCSLPGALNDSELTGWYGFGTFR